MKGFLKIKAIDFDTWNNNATIKVNENGISCDCYTFSFPDVDSQYVWARVEHDFITDTPVVSSEDAVIAGMRVME